MSLAHILGKGRVFFLFAILGQGHSSRLANGAHLNRQVSRLLHRYVANVARVVARQVATRR